MKSKLFTFIVSKGVKYWLLNGVLIPATGFIVNIGLTLGYNAWQKKKLKKAEKQEEKQEEVNNA